MSLSVEPRFGIDRIVLDKDALDGVKGRELGCVADLVKVVYHGAIELPEKGILATCIFGDRYGGRIAIINKIQIGTFDRTDSG
jgi:hypothetical protein